MSSARTTSKVRTVEPDVKVTVEPFLSAETALQSVDNGTSAANIPTDFRFDRRKIAAVLQAMSAAGFDSVRVTIGNMTFEASRREHVESNSESVTDETIQRRLAAMGRGDK